MLDRSEVGKRGYLNEGFRLFHLKDSRAPKLDYHYHEFDKLILLLGGKVTYVVEGVTYFLQPWDILLVNRDGKLCELHKVLDRDCALKMVTAQDKPGIQTYERSALFLMLKAFYDVAGRENVERISVEYSLSSALFILARGNFTLDQALLDRVGAKAENTQFGSCVFANKPGDGSAREQAASCQKVLGGFAHLCYAFATKRYRSNCINWGILPFTLDEGTAFPYEAGDCVFVPDVRQAVRYCRNDIHAKVLRADGSEEDITLHLPAPLLFEIVSLSCTGWL